MSMVTYDAGTMTITVEGMEDVAEALGDLKSKTPAAAKVAINATAREARKLMFAKAKARYAVNAAGRRHLKDLTQRKKATNTSLVAELFIAKMGSDLGYFKNIPSRAYEGAAVSRAPKFFKGKVLKSSGMKELSGGWRDGYGDVSKGFLIEFKSGHVGMVQRDIGSESDNLRTIKNNRPRYIPQGKDKPEKLVTMNAPSATAMHSIVWPLVEPDVVEYLQDRLMEQTERIIERAKAKRG